MPAHRRLPDKTTLARLRLREKWTLARFAEEYGVTQSAVWKALVRSGVEPEGKPTYRDLVPWIVEKRHQATAVMDRLRDLNTRLNGGILAPAESFRLDRWLEMLGSEGLVVDYSPDTPPNPASRKVGGFSYATRAEGETGIFRLAAVGVAYETQRDKAA